MNCATTKKKIKTIKKFKSNPKDKEGRQSGERKSRELLRRSKA
jgi:hypothetical protein